VEAKASSPRPREARYADRAEEAREEAEILKAKVAEANRGEGEEVPRAEVEIYSCEVFNEGH
jgi:hypothetical protein